MLGFVEGNYDYGDYVWFDVCVDDGIDFGGDCFIVYV